MQTLDMQPVLEELVKTVAFLCDETASLVVTYSHSSAVQHDDVAGIMSKAENIRNAGTTLRSMLSEVHMRKAS